MSAKKKAPNPYRLQPVARKEEPKEEKHHPDRINLKEGDVVDPSRYNNAFCCRSPILEPARVLGVRHDEKNPYYTQVKLACESGTMWLGQSWLEWEGKRKA